MSRIFPTPFELPMLGRICRYCGAAPGVWCTTPSDGWAVSMHSDRFYQEHPCPWRPAGTDFPRDVIAGDRLARVLAEITASDA